MQKGLYFHPGREKGGGKEKPITTRLRKKKSTKKGVEFLLYTNGGEKGNPSIVLSKKEAFAKFGVRGERRISSYIPVGGRRRKRSTNYQC